MVPPVPGLPAPVPGPAAPAPDYGIRYKRGVKYQKWIDNDPTAGEVCPFGPCQLRISDIQSCTIFTDEQCGEPGYPDSGGSDSIFPSSSQGQSPDAKYESPIPDPGKPGPTPEGSYVNAWAHIEKTAKPFNVTLPFGADQEAQKDEPAHRVMKYDPFEASIDPRQREGRMDDLRASTETNIGTKDPFDNPFMNVVTGWDGVVAKGSMVITYVKRHAGEAYMHEVTNAIYTHLVPEDKLKYIFVTNIRNIDTRGFIQHQIYGKPNGTSFPPMEGKFPNPHHFLHGSPEYHGLLGTEIGRMIGRFVLGRYPHGTCKITQISIALLGEHDSLMKEIDMMFQLEPTQEPVGLPVTPYPSSSEEPEDRAAAQQAQNRLYNRYRETMALKRAAETQDEENKERYGRTRSGKQRKRD